VDAGFYTTSHSSSADVVFLHCCGT